MALQFPFKKMRLAVAVVAVALTGCTKEYTNFYADGQEDGLAIFSNTGNNLMTCYMNGVPWQTRPRAITTFIVSGRNYELYIRKQNYNGVMDTLSFEWPGDVTANANNQGTVSLSLIMPKGFGYKEFNALQGKRIAVNSTNGYFNSAIASLNPLNVQGTGFVYFHTALLDSVAPGFYTGKMSGLIEADFNGKKLTKGRFDHTLETQQVFF